MTINAKAWALTRHELLLELFGKLHDVRNAKMAVKDEKAAREPRWV